MNRILRKIGMVSLGCPKNTVDSELVLGTLASKGYNITADAGGAEVIVVNTCGFIDSAKEESIDTILEMAEYKRKGSCQKLIVMGCLSKRYKDELLKEIPEVDYIVGTGDFKSVVKIIESDNGIEKVLVREPAFDYNEDTPRMLTTPRYTAYVKIAEGCSNRCSFCIIPKIRGPFKSRPADSIVREVEILSGHGVEEEKICKYIDLPLQHSDDKILSKMMRQERGDKIRDLVNKIRKAIPDVAIRTVFIVGFPGEADTHFGHLVNFIKEMRFEHLGIFTYSPEEGTTAAEMSDQIPDEVKIERRDIIMKLQQKISSENNKRFVGMMRDVLVEDSVSDNEFLIKGRMQTQAPDIDGIVYIEEGDARVGDILPVKITRTMEYDFIGRAVNR